MKKNIRNWWKTNMSDCIIDKKVVNIFKKIIAHEIIHYKIAKKYTINKGLTLELAETEDEKAGFYYNASFDYNYPHNFNFPKYYPIFVFIEFKHFLFDVICDIFSFTIFTTFRYRLFMFLKCLISFKVRSK